MNNTNTNNTRLPLSHESTEFDFGTPAFNDRSLIEGGFKNI